MGDARQLSYFSDYKNEPLVCPECDWHGTWSQGSHEYFDSLADCSCPSKSGCSGPILAIVANPTSAEYEENRERLSAAEKAFGDAQVAFQKHFDEVALKEVNQLPDLQGDALNLVWDQEGEETVLRKADVEIWREPAVWDGYQRFLKARYGSRLQDLEPTEASMENLLGDNSAASSIVADARAGILANDPLRPA